MVPSSKQKEMKVAPSTLWQFSVTKSFSTTITWTRSTPTYMTFYWYSDNWYEKYSKTDNRYSHYNNKVNSAVHYMVEGIPQVTLAYIMSLVSLLYK